MIWFQDISIIEGLAILKYNYDQSMLYTGVKDFLLDDRKNSILLKEIQLYMSNIFLLSYDENFTPILINNKSILTERYSFEYLTDFIDFIEKLTKEDKIFVIQLIIFNIKTNEFIVSGKEIDEYNKSDILAIKKMISFKRKEKIDSLLNN